MKLFEVNQTYEPRGDQPKVIDAIALGLERGLMYQDITGATGTGKTYVMAKIIERVGRSALVLSHNKTLAAQLYREFQHFFPNNKVEYFVSYYDYYQPEAYVVKKDLYIEKDSSINEEIDRMRLQATASLIEADDVIVVASVSCIYGLGSPEHYRSMYINLQKGQTINRRHLLEKLISIQYVRDDKVFSRGKFRVRGDVIDIYLAYKDMAYRIELFGDEVERLGLFDVFNHQVITQEEQLTIFPAKHFVMPEQRLTEAIKRIEDELKERASYFSKQQKFLEKERLLSRTRYDIEMMQSVNYCTGIENYSRHLSGRAEGEPPATLIDYFGEKNFITFIDESHVTVPQLRGMYNGDRKRKESLVNYGFRLPSALDNRPLYLEEFLERNRAIVFVSATPNAYELSLSKNHTELINRPTGLLDPVIDVRSTEGQIDDLIHEVNATIREGFRTLITTLTKKMSEKLTTFFKEKGFKVHYLHSDIDTIERVEILKSLREGTIDVLIGINLLREGLDLPEVALVAILDADKIGFLRSKTSLIQTVGRAARNVKGRVIMYADRVSEAMQDCIHETERRRHIQMTYNQAHHITPKSIMKPVEDILVREIKQDTPKLKPADLFNQKKTLHAGQQAAIPSPKNKTEAKALLKRLEFEMRLAGDQLNFERAIELRETIKQLRLKMNL